PRGDRQAHSASSAHPRAHHGEGRRQDHRGPTSAGLGARCHHGHSSRPSRMTSMKRALAVALLALATVGCSVPSSDLDPGAAFTYDGRTVTNAEIDAIYTAWVYDTRGKDTPNRRQVLTIEAVREEAMKAAQPFIDDGS